MGSEQSHELHKNASDAAAKIEVCGLLLDVRYII